MLSVMLVEREAETSSRISLENRRLGESLQLASEGTHLKWQRMLYTKQKALSFLIATSSLKLRELLRSKLKQTLMLSVNTRTRWPLAWCKDTKV